MRRNPFRLVKFSFLCHFLPLHTSSLSLFHLLFYSVSLSASAARYQKELQRSARYGYSFASYSSEKRPTHLLSAFFLILSLFLSQLNDVRAVGCQSELTRRRHKRNSDTQVGAAADGLGINAAFARDRTSSFHLGIYL